MLTRVRRSTCLTIVGGCRHVPPGVVCDEGCVPKAAEQCVPQRRCVRHDVHVPGGHTAAAPAAAVGASGGYRLRRGGLGAAGLVTARVVSLAAWRAQWTNCGVCVPLLLVAGVVCGSRARLLGVVVLSISTSYSIPFTWRGQVSSLRRAIPTFYSTPKHCIAPAAPVQSFLSRPRYPRGNR